jgi:protein-S-isoprenylcysteine O-methyltransferase Ste14
VRKEELMMLDTFGEAYADYAARTRRMIPGVL